MIQTIKDHFRITLIITLLFAAIAAMYSGVYPAFEDLMGEMAQSFGDSFTFIPGSEDFSSYAGFLNIELYQIFWLLIFGILVGFVSASLIAKEVESKTIDLFLANPISRKQIIFEKYLGIVPFILVVNFVTMFVVYGTTIAINEEIDFGYLVLTHLVSIPYFLSIAAIGLLISIIIDEKMKASIFMIALLMGMFIFRSISLMIPDYESIGFLSLSHYFNPYDILTEGFVDLTGVVVLTVVIIECLLVSMFYFSRKDIKIS